MQPLMCRGGEEAGEEEGPAYGAVRHRVQTVDQAISTSKTHAVL